ncbi:TetR/AcrR family transcriptional regulator [Marinactinospora thermotolerans]|uniref:TetR/AcrR family transcriptional regulator n=1 Tax=Marinactinospora thermotolerans TaxID=531310 RepID=UPI003D89B8FC
MPRSMDLQARERQVIEASWRVIARQGMRALTVRNIAQEAGLAPSSLRYAFPTQDSVREKSIRAVLERLRERVAAIAPDSPSWAWQTFQELLPLDDERRLEMEVSLALGTAAVTDPLLAPLRAELDAEVYSLCERACAALGLERPGLARELQALIDGLALHVVLVPGDDGRWTLEVLRLRLQELGVACD